MEQIPVGPFGGYPVQQELWLILAEKIRVEFPAAEFREAKTQIGVAEGRTYAAVSLPRAKDMGAGQGGDFAVPVPRLPGLWPAGGCLCAGFGKPVHLPHPHPQRGGNRRRDSELPPHGAGGTCA